MTAPPGKLYSGCIDLRDRNSAATKIVELVGRAKRILEVGCASGYMSKFLAQERQCRVTGIEANPVAAAEAAPHCEAVIVGDVENGALTQVVGQFDVIIFADVLEHLRAPLSVLRASTAHLRAGGYVLVSLPNVAHWEVRRALIRGRFDYTRTGILDDTHLRFFTYETAIALAHQGGFRVDYWDLVFRGPRHWKYTRFYRRWEKPIHWVIARYCRGLFAYQFIFRLRPAGPTCGDEDHAPLPSAGSAESATTATSN